MSNEQLMTEIYTRAAWGSQELRSGPCSSLERTQELRSQLSLFFQTFQIQSILDCGCGDWTWMSQVDLSEIKYIGVDIVDPLLEYLQTKYSTPTVQFQKVDVMEDPPETADLWLVRDLLCLYPISSYSLFFKRFLESGSKYIALSSVESEEANDPGILGIWRKLNLNLPPFELDTPIYSMADGKQWNSNKKLVIFTREQIQEWLDKQPTNSISEALPQNNSDDTRDMNAYRLSNIPLRLRSLHDHTG